MSLSPDSIGPVPAETARVARAAFPKGNVYLQLRDLVGTLYEDADFAPLCASRGRPAVPPWRVALVTVMQFAEGLSDRQAAEAVRARIDWKYVLGLELTDPGFDYSVLSEFRARLIAGGAEQQVFDALLAVCKERGYLKARGRQRTDATHVLGAMRLLNRLELVAETLRATLNALAVVAPDWLRQQTPAEWFARYGRRIEEYRLPQGADARQAYAETVGRDGLQLLAALDAPDAPATLHQLPAVALLRATWSQQYVVDDEPVRLREPDALPSASEHRASPYEPEARYGRKRGTEWVGYKVHLTESCDAEGPHLLTQVETTIAPAPDVAALPVIQAALAQAALLPAVQLVDTGYVCGANLVASRTDHQIELVGPMYADHQWQAKAQQGFALAHFQIDWAEQVVTCPRDARACAGSR